ALEPRIVLARGLIGGRPDVAREALPRLWRHLRHAAIRRIDHERRALAAVDGRVLRSRVDPEAVVAADVSGGTGRTVTAERRRGTIAFELRVAGDPARIRRLLTLLHVLVAQHERRSRRALDRRERREIVGALQIGMSIGDARNGRPALSRERDDRR